MSTQARALLLAAGSEAEASRWLYAFNPLLASNKYFEVNLQYKKDLSGKTLEFFFNFWGYMVKYPIPKSKVSDPLNYSILPKVSDPYVRYPIHA